MGMNMLGAGFLFSGQDKGLGKMTGEATKGFASVTDSVKGLAAATSGFVLSKALRMPDFGAAANSIMSMAGDMKITTTSVEAFGVQAGKVASESFAGLNISTKQMKRMSGQATSLAYGLNMPVEQVTDRMTALHQAGLKVESLGFKNMGQFQKFMAVSGADAKKFIPKMAFLKKQLGLDDQQMGSFLDTTVSLGKEMDLGKEAVQGMADSAALLQEFLPTIMQNLGPDKAKRYVSGIQMVSGAFMKAGYSAEEAGQLSQSVAKGLLVGREQFNKIYAGLEDSTEGMPDILMQSFGGAEAAFQLLSETPDVFISKMILAQKKIRENIKDPEMAAKALGRFQQQMKDIMGPQVAGLFTEKFSDVAGVLDETSKKLNDGKLTGGVNALAKAYKTGLTDTDHFARAQAAFETQIVKMGKSLDGGPEAFLKNYKNGADEIGKSMAALAKDNGPVGAATRMFAKFKVYGIGGTLASMVPMGPAILDMANMFGPIVQQLPGIIAGFTALASPIGLLIGGLAVLYFYFKDLEEGSGKFAAGLENIGAKAMDFAGKALNTFVEMMPKIAETIGKLVGKLGEVLGKVNWGKVANALFKGFEVALNAVLTMAGPLLDLVGKLMGALLEGLKQIDWGRVSQIMYGLAMKAIDFFGQATLKLLDFGGWLVKKLRNLDWGKVAQVVVALGKKIGYYAIEAIKKVVAMLPDIFVAIVKGAWALLKEIAKEIWDWLDGLTGGLLDSAKNKVKEAYDWVTGLPGRAWGSVKGALSSVTNWVRGESEGTGEWIGKMMEQQRRLIRQAEGDTKSSLGRVKDWMQTNLNKMTGFVGNLASQGLALLKDKTQLFKEQTAEAFQVTPEQAANLLESLANVDPKVFKKDLESIRASYVGFLRGVVKEGQVLMVTTRKQFDALHSEQKRFWPSMEGLVSTFINNTRSALDLYWANVIKNVQSQSATLVLTTTRMFERLKTVLGKVNILDFITSEDQINLWALRVVSGLQNAFVGRRVFEPAFEQAFRNATGLIEALRTNQGELKVTNSFQQTDTNAARGDMVAELRDTINRPAWWNDASGQLKTICNKLDGVIRAAGGGRKESQPHTSSPPSRRSTNLPGDDYGQ